MKSDCCNAQMRVEGDETHYYVCTLCGKACDPATPMSKPDESVAFRDFLKKLDESEDVTVTDWEAQFIESNLTRDNFSGKQREIVMKLMDKYGRRIGYY